MKLGSSSHTQYVVVCPRGSLHINTGYLSLPSWLVHGPILGKARRTDMEEQPQQQHKPIHECTNKSQNYGQSLSDWATNPDTNHSSCTSSYAPCIFDLGSSLTHYPGGRPSFSHIHPASQPSFINIHQRQSMSGDLLS